MAFGLAAARAAAAPSLAQLDPKVMSYYPSTGGWTTMWQRWDPARYRADFRRVAGLGATSVRIIVQAGVVGFPQPEPLYLDRLHELVTIAGEEGLTVQLTLFDWLGEHGLAGSYADIAGSEQWASVLLGPYVGDPRLAFVEVRNELDANNPAALAWAHDLIPFVRQVLLGEVPVTVSVSAADPVASLRALKLGLGGADPDFYTLHYFTGGGETSYWTLRDAQAAVAPTALWLGETGYPTSVQISGYSDLPETPSAQGAAQAHFLKTIAFAARQAGLPAPGVWTLDDFAPGTIPVEPELQKEPEYDFGLFTLDGKEKPAAAVMRQVFAGRAPTAFNEGFETVVADGRGGSLPAEWSGYADPRMGLGVGLRAHRGRHAARIWSRDGRAGSGVFYVAPIAAFARPRHEAVASAWMRSASRGARVRIALDWLDAAGNYLATRNSPAPARSTGWTQVRVAAVPPPEARSVRIYLKVARSPGTVWFDDVRFVWR